MVVLSKWWCCLRPILLLKLNPSFCSTTSVYIISVTLCVCVRACVRACVRVCAVRLLLLSWLCSWWTTLYIPHLTGFYISCRSRRTSYRYYDITFKIKSQFLFYDCINKCDSVCVCVCVCARVCVCVCVCVFAVRLLLLAWLCSWWTLLTAGNRLNAKVSTAVEKVQPFTRPEILQKKGKVKKKVQPMHVWTLTNCNLYNVILSMEVQVNTVVHNKPIFILYHG